MKGFGDSLLGDTTSGRDRPDRITADPGRQDATSCCDDSKDLALSILLDQIAAQAAQARFDEAGVLSAMPCCWPPTLRHFHETQMAQLFAGLQARNGKRGSPSMSSDAMQQGLRLFGLCNVTASSCDAVSGP